MSKECCEYAWVYLWFFFNFWVCQGKKKNREEKRHKTKHKKKKKKKKIEEKTEKTIRNSSSTPAASASSAGVAVKKSNTVDQLSCQAKKFAPMSKEEWERKQSQLRRQVSPTSGRVR